MEILQVLREFGFPIFVCIWFMHRMERKVDALAERVLRLLLQHHVSVSDSDGVPTQQLEGSSSGLSETGRVRKGKKE